MGKNKLPSYESLKASISLYELLKFYGQHQSLEEIGGTGDRWRGRCPFHHGDNPQSFRIMGDRWKCYSCRRYGTAIDIVFRFDNTIDNKSFPAGIRRLDEIRKDLNLDVKQDKPRGKKKSINDAKSWRPKKLPWTRSCNKFLARERGLTPETCQHFGLRMTIAQTGILSRRIIIPIHDAQGKQISWAARKTISDQEGPKYLMPEGFPAWMHLYNMDRAIRIDERVDIVVVEGYFDVYRVHQAGYPHVVSPFGSYMTSQQADLLHRYAKSVILMYDGDPAGQRAAESAAKELFVKTYTVDLPEGSDPGGMSEEEILHYL